MASMNASGEAAMRLAMCIGNLTSIRTVEKVAANLGEETNRCIRVSIQWRRHPHADRGRVRPGSWARAQCSHTILSAALLQCCHWFPISVDFVHERPPARAPLLPLERRKRRLSQKAPIYLVDSHY
jgi:hypothetical protein